MGHRYQGDDGLGHPSHPRLLEVDPRDPCGAHVGRRGQLVERVPADEALVHAGEGRDEAFQDRCQVAQ